MEFDHSNGNLKKVPLHKLGETVDGGFTRFNSFYIEGCGVVAVCTKHKHLYLSEQNYQWNCLLVCFTIASSYLLLSFWWFLTWRNPGAMGHTDIYISRVSVYSNLPETLCIYSRCHHSLSSSTKERQFGQGRIWQSSNSHGNTCSSFPTASKSFCGPLSITWSDYHT